MLIRIIFSKSLDKKGIPILITMSRIYSQLAEKWHAIVRHFSARTYYISAVAKIIGPIDTWEFGLGMLWGAGLIVYSLQRPFITPSE